MAKGLYNLNVVYSDLKDMINGVAERFGNDSAFKYEKRGVKTDISYLRFKNDIDGFGTYLFKNGYNGDKKIALLGENSYEWVMTYFAAVNGGNIIIPLDKELKSNELLVLLNASETDILVYSKQKQKTVDEMVENGLKIQNLVCMTELEEKIEEGTKAIERLMSRRCVQLFIHQELQVIQRELCLITKILLEMHILVFPAVKFQGIQWQFYR